MQFEPIPDASSSVEQSSKHIGKSLEFENLDEVKVKEMKIDHKSKVSMNTIETDKCQIEDKIEQYQNKHVTQYDDQDVFSEIQVPNGSKPISAPRASALRYEPAIDAYEMQDPLTCTIPKDSTKQGLNLNGPMIKNSQNQSEVSSVTSTIGNFRAQIQIVSAQNLEEMSELDKEMYRRQLKDEIQYLIKKEQKGKTCEEELALLQKNMKLEQDLHDSEFQNRKLQLWILDDKHNEMKSQLKQEQDQNKRMAQMLDDLRENIRLVRDQVEAKDADIHQEKTGNEGQLKTHQEIIDSQKNDQNESFQLTDELEKEQEKLKFETQLKNDKQVVLDELLNLIKKKEKKLDKETEKKQKMYIQMRNDERNVTQVEKEIEQYNEAIERDDELRDMYETQKSFLEKQSNIFMKNCNKLQQKLDAGNNFINYGQKNNDCLKAEIAEDKKIVNKMVIANSRLEHDILTANSQIEQSQSLIENVQKNIELIEKSKETIEKTTQAHIKNFQNISNLKNSTATSQQLDDVLSLKSKILNENSVELCDDNSKSNEKAESKRSQLSTDDVKTGDERQPKNFNDSTYGKYIDNEVERQSRRSPIKDKKSSPTKKSNSPLKKNISPIKKEFKENIENVNNYLVPRQVAASHKQPNPMSKFLDQTQDSAQVRMLDVSGEMKKHEDGIFAQNVNTENKIQVLHTSVQYDMSKNRVYENQMDTSKENDMMNPSADDLYKSRIGVHQSSAAQSQNTSMNVDQRVKDRTILQQQTAELIKKSQEKRNVASSSNGMYETSNKLIESSNQMNPNTDRERHQQFQSVNAQQRTSPIPPRQNSYKSNYSRFLKGESQNPASAKDIYHSAEPQKMTRFGQFQSQQTMYHQNKQIEASSSQSNFATLKLGNVNKVEHHQNQDEVSVISALAKTSELDQKSSRRKPHAISDILKAKKQTSQVSLSQSNPQFQYSHQMSQNVPKVQNQNQQQVAHENQEYVWQNQYSRNQTHQNTQQQPARSELSNISYHEQPSRNQNHQSQYSANEYHRDQQFKFKEYEPYQTQSKPVQHSVTNLKDQEPDGHEKCSLIDLSSHSLRHFNELSKQQKNYDTQSKQNDPGMVCNDSAESFVQELRELEVVQPNGYSMPVEHSRYNPQVVDYTYGDRRSTYQQNRPISKDKPITEENHKSFMARYASKQSDYNVRVQPQFQHNQSQSEHKDTYHSRFEKKEDINSQYDNANHQQYSRNIEDYSESSKAYDQFMAQKESKVEFRSKFAQKGNIHNEVMNPMDSGTEHTERTNNADLHSPIKKQY